jgi:hypothetical protein
MAQWRRLTCVQCLVHRQISVRMMVEYIAAASRAGNVRTVMYTLRTIPDDEHGSRAPQCPA